MKYDYMKVVQDVIHNLEPKKKALPYLELDSMMLSQVVEVAKRVSQNDINSTHIQNWVRRKYLPSPIKKKYNREHVATILLINDLRNILSLEEITHLLGFVNKDLTDLSDDSINPTKLYRYYSEIFDRTQTDWEKSLHEMNTDVEEILAEEVINDDDKEKVKTTLIILNLLARANLYRQISEQWLTNLKNKKS